MLFFMRRTIFKSLDCIRYSKALKDQTWEKRLYYGAYGIITETSVHVVAAILVVCEMF